jgi:hypothetical protein
VSETRSHAEECADSGCDSCGARALLPAAGDGCLDEDSGYSHFEVKFFCLVFRPFKNEILLAKVHTITNVSRRGRDERTARDDVRTRPLATL